MIDFNFLLSSETLAKLPTPTPEAKQLLQQQIITDKNPGTILQDFQKMLDFIGENGCEVSEVNAYFSMKKLRDINAFLSYPIEIDLKRPQQKSYPYIHALYLLLRISGLAYPNSQNKKKLLVLDQELFTSWHRLNPTERYLILLEIGMLWADENILDGYTAYPNLFVWHRFLSEIPAKGASLNKQNKRLFEFHAIPGFTNLALLHLFGIVNLRQGKPEAGKGWRVTYVEKTAFGEAIVQVLLHSMMANPNLLILENAQSITHGKLQPMLQEYFSEYQQQLVLDGKLEKTEGIYIFKVSLDKAWRRIAIPSHLTLEPLVDSILNSFDFGQDHLYRFICCNRIGMPFNINHPYMEDEPPFTNRFRVEELPLKIGEIMIFNFDFGDDWEFALLLEAINPPDKTLKKPKLLESHGTAPEQYPDYDEEEYYDEEE